jgi:hypothetical protein
MTAKKSSDKPIAPAARNPKGAKRRDELEASELDKVTGGLSSSKIVKSADPCEGGR